MRKIFLYVIIVVIAQSLAADMGLWHDLYHVSGGTLYSDTPHQTIALEKEYLQLDNFNSGNVNAWFYFKNNGETTTVQIGFPIEITFSQDEMLLVQGKLFYPEGQKGIAVFSKPFMQYGGKTWPFTHIKSAKIPVSSAIHDGYDEKTEYIRISDFTDGRIEIAAADIADPSIIPYIEQDGVKINVQSVVVEKKRGQSLTLRFHFRFEIVFNAQKYSTVLVRYPSDILHKMEEGEDYRRFTSMRWRYVLSTGATWNGPIGDMVLALPAGAVLTEKGWSSIGFFNGYDMYRKTAFEPTGSEMITAYIREYDQEEYYEKETVISWAKIKKTPAFLQNITASSYLNEKGEAFRFSQCITGVPFGPEALFDGMRESAWCEGMPDEGIGQTVSFTLTEDKVGFRVQNGYMPALFKAKFDGDKTQLYHMNSRPKELLLSAVDGSVSYRLTLKDMPTEWQYFQIRLEKGRYTLQIMSVYNGSKWKDTCLGEMEFSAFPATLHTTYAGDVFFAQFFKTVMQQ